MTWRKLNITETLHYSHFLSTNNDVFSSIFMHIEYFEIRIILCITNHQDNNDNGIKTQSALND